MDVAFVVSYFFLWVVVIIQGLALLEIVRHLGAVHTEGTRLSESGVVADAIEKQLPSLVGVSAVDGSPAQWPAAPGRHVVVVLTTTCGPCRKTAADLAALAKTPTDYPLTVLVEAPISAASALIDDTGIPRGLAVIDDGARTTSSLPRVRPIALVVESGRITKASIPHGLAELRELVADPRSVGGLAAGRAAGAAASRS